MSMPFRQHMPDYIAPCGTHEFKQIIQKDGSIKTVLADEKLPPVEKFETKNIVKAGLDLTEVSSFVIDPIPNEPKEPETNNTED